MRNEEKPLLSLDIWDTLVRRRTFPDNIKTWSHMRYKILAGEECLSPNIQILTERQLLERSLAQKNVDLGFDNEHPIREVYKLFESISEERVLDVIDFEFSTEIRMSYPDFKILGIIGEYSNYEIIVISDFYFDSGYLRKLLKVHHPKMEISKIYSSSDFLYNKTGGLFPKILEENQKYFFRDWTHIGDSIISDVKGAEQIGINAEHFEPQPEHEIRTQLARDFNLRVENGDVNNITPKSLVEAFGVGLNGFAEYIRAEALRENRKILFIEREGIVLREIFQVMQEVNALKLPIVENDTVALSRISVSAAYAAENLTKVTARFIKMYPKANFLQFLNSLGIIETDNFDLSITDIRQSLKVSENQTQIRLHCESNAKNFRLYFEQFGLANQKFLLVDVGWMGSIQEHLSNLLPLNDFRGLYLGMYANSHMLNQGLSKSFLDINKANYQKITHNVRPIEMLFMPANQGSVLGYNSTGQPIRKTQDASWNPPLEFEHFMKSVILELPRTIRYCEDNLITIYESREILQNAVQNFISKPTKPIVKSYLNSHYDETFGLGATVKTNDLSLKRIITSVFKCDIGSLRKMWNHVGWEEAAYYQLFRRLPKVQVEKTALKVIESIHFFFIAIKRISTLRKIKFSDVILRRDQFLFSLRNYGFRATMSKVVGYVNYRTQVELAGESTPQDTELVALNQAKLCFVYLEQEIDKIEMLKVISISRSLGMKTAAITFEKLRSKQSNSLKNKRILLSQKISELQKFELIGTHPDNLFIDEISKSFSASSAEMPSKNSPVLKAAWIINGLPKGSGGHRGMFRMALQLEKIGIQNNFYILNDVASSERLKERFKEHFYDVPINIFTNLPFYLNEQMIFATAPATLQIAKRHRSPSSSLFYFIQDDEALFHPVSSAFFKAREDMQDPDLILIASGRWMKERIKEITGRDVFYFPFPIDHDIYNSKNLDLDSKKRQLLVYFKPEAVRRLSELALEVIEIVQGYIPDLKIVTFGSDHSPETRHGVEHRGQLKTLGELSELYRESSLALMFSPTNPSLLPYEMAACGLPVVDYREFNDLTKKFFQDETGVELANANAFDIAYRIIELFLNPRELRERQQLVITKSLAVPNEEQVGFNFATFVKEHFKI
jgi:hypothetical protein